MCKGEFREELENREGKCHWLIQGWCITKSGESELEKKTCCIKSSYPVPATNQCMLPPMGFPDKFNPYWIMNDHRWSVKLNWLLDLDPFPPHPFPALPPKKASFPPSNSHLLYLSHPAVIPRQISSSNSKSGSRNTSIRKDKDLGGDFKGGWSEKFLIP